MFQQRSGVGHGSMYHHFLGKGKDGLALDAISHMRASTLAFLDGSPTPAGSEPEEGAGEYRGGAGSAVRP